MNFIYNPMTNRIEPTRTHPTMATWTIVASTGTVFYGTTS